MFKLNTKVNKKLVFRCLNNNLIARNFHIVLYSFCTLRPFLNIKKLIQIDTRKVHLGFHPKEFNYRNTKKALYQHASWLRQIYFTDYKDSLKARIQYCIKFSEIKWCSHQTLWITIKFIIFVTLVRLCLVKILFYVERIFYLPTIPW